MSLSGGSANPLPIRQVSHVPGLLRDSILPPPAPDVGPLIDSVVGSDPFAGRAQVLRTANTLSAPAFDYAVAIPARDEEGFLPRCIESLSRAMEQAARQSGASGALVIALHDSTDRSFDLVRNAFAAADIAGLAVEFTLDPEVRNAPHARRFALDLAVRLCPGGVLLTSDADTRVGPGWCCDMLGAIRSGYDLVCEDIRLDEEELARLPDSVREVGEAERAFFDASNALWDRWTGGAHGVFAHRPSGASMALRSDVYGALGALPLPPSGEDAALCDMALKAGCKVVTLGDCGTRTSARIYGRAEGGCGAALNERAHQEDPLCDGRLMRVADLRLLANRVTGSQGETAANARLQPLRYSELLRELGKARAILR